MNEVRGSRFVDTKERRLRRREATSPEESREPLVRGRPLFIVRLPSFATLSINGDSPFASIFHLQQITDTDVFIVFWLTSWLTFSRQPARQPRTFTVCTKRKKHRQSRDYQCFLSVGVTGFEPATTRPPDAYSNRAELHPAAQLRCKSRTFYLPTQLFEVFFRILSIKLLLLSKIVESDRCN